MIIDQRTETEKINDILRVWSQLMNPAEVKLWSDIAERDISHDISLKHGIRTPKCLVDEELKKYKLASLQQRKDILNSKIHTLPAPEMTKKERYKASNDPLSDTLSILPDELCVNQAFIAKISQLTETTEQLPRESVGHVPDSAPVSQNTAQGPCESAGLVPDPVHSALLEDCKLEILAIRNSSRIPPKLSKILLRNRPLLYSYLHVII